LGLFGIFGSREERERGALRRLGKKVTERYGPPENRQKAIEQLAGMGTPGALSTLCLRFTVRAEVGITDDEEKETVRRHLVAAGDAALPPVREFLERQESGVSWGLRVLSALREAGEVKAVVLALLEKAGKEYSRDPEKKLVLLSWLAEHHARPAATWTAAPASASTRVRGEGGAETATLTPEERAIIPLLEDFSDDVRIAAARALSRLGAGAAGREALVQLLLRDRDNARVRGEVLQALHDLGADVKGNRPSVEPLLVEPFFLDREGRVKKRG
jgi:HEAT repeat protein